jgi:hypothetical protein
VIPAVGARSEVVVDEGRLIESTLPQAATTPATARNTDKITSILTVRTRLTLIAGLPYLRFPLQAHDGMKRPSGANRHRFYALIQDPG